MAKRKGDLPQKQNYVRGAGKLEQQIRSELKSFLELRGWHVEIFHGNVYQMGIPDLYLKHPVHGERWVDVKRPTGYSLTKAQQHKWPIWEQVPIGIWILTAATAAEYQKLFEPPNWRRYWRKSYDTKRKELQELLGALSGGGANTT